MSAEEVRKNAICNFTMKVCSKERYIEIKRQILADKSDFEPYVAFRRIARGKNKGITASNIHKFVSDNLIDITLKKCDALVKHYDADKDGLLSYKEFLEIVLPKEHPDLRAFVTQRECFDITDDEYLSYETEISLALLIEKEICMFTDCYDEKLELDKLDLTCDKLVEIIDLDEEGNLNFKNLRNFFHDSGLLPYDAEIISLLRRVDRDDDGVILVNELEDFMGLFFDPETETEIENIKRNQDIKQEDVRRESPGRKIVRNKISLLSDKKIMVKPKRGPAKQTSGFDDAIRGSKKYLDKREAQSSYGKASRKKLSDKLQRGSSKKVRESPGRYNRPSVANYEEKTSIKTTTKYENRVERPEDIPKYRKKLSYADNNSSSKFKYSRPPQNVSAKKPREVERKQRVRAPVVSKQVIEKTVTKVSPQKKMIRVQKPPERLMESPRQRVETQNNSSKYSKYRRQENLRPDDTKRSQKEMRREPTSHASASNLAYQRSRERIRHSKTRASPARAVRTSVTSSRNKIEVKTEIRESNYNRVKVTQEGYSPARSRDNREVKVVRSSARKRSPAKRSPVQVSPARRSPSQRSPVKRSPLKRSPVRRTSTRRSPERRSIAKRSPAKRSPAKRSPVKRSPVKRSPVKRSPDRRSPAKRSARERTLNSNREHLLDRSYSRSRSRSHSPRKIESQRRAPTSPREYRVSPSKKSPTKRYIRAGNSPGKRDARRGSSPTREDYMSRLSNSSARKGRIVVTRTSPVNPKHQVIQPSSAARNQPLQIRSPARAANDPQSSRSKAGYIQGSLSKQNLNTDSNTNVRVVRKYVKRDMSQSPPQEPAPLERQERISMRHRSPAKKTPIRIRGSRHSATKRNSVTRKSVTRNSTKRNLAPRNPSPEAKPTQMKVSFNENNSEIFFKALAIIVKQERKLENARRELVSREDFFIKEIFNMIDKKSRGWFTIEDFRQFLTVIGVKDLDTRALIDLYSSFDSNQNCLLNFHELVNMVCPQSPAHAQFIDREIEQSDFDDVGQETLAYLADMFSRLFSLRRSIFDAKKMIRQDAVDLHAVFDELDRRNQGFITKEDIEAFLKSFSREFGGKMDELEVLSNRMDIDKDSKINFKDFYMFFTL